MYRIEEAVFQGMYKKLCSNGSNVVINIRVLYSCGQLGANAGRDAETCERFGWLKTWRAAAFWIIWRVLSEHAGRPVRIVSRHI